VLDFFLAGLFLVEDFFLVDGLFLVELDFFLVEGDFLELLDFFALGLFLALGLFFAFGLALALGERAAPAFLVLLLFFLREAILFFPDGDLAEGELEDLDAKRKVLE
jgi:hypothetical protein